ncbi:GNAT family N-acetyltransferase [Variovorax sp. SRS16]|uniref:GNAT family N-acetyltransferase n=1 Tax=Variovorax sp. SRS16 TaxID=282217 RepID=UPI001E39C8AD|nr:GNAT family N-acetyltransferase [Variovorax sp. SRS16]
MSLKEPPMPVVFRPAHAEELGRAEELVVSSINDLCERHGFGRMASLRPPHFQNFSLQDDPDGLWVAEEAGQILGFTHSWVCGDLWFLSELFVSPAHQGRGIGNELLTRALAHAQKAASTRKALITFTFNTVSQGLYIRHGLFPRLPIYLLKVNAQTLALHLQGTQLRCVPLEDTASDLESLARIDAGALGVSREKHHRYLIHDHAMRGVILHAGTDRVGYAYVSADGHVGPLAVTHPEACGEAFRAALHLAAQSGAPNVSAFLPGVSATLGVAIAHGMRITLPMVLMSAQAVGDWNRYLPRNPGFM